MEPIAIIGIGCRFPKADNPEAFWQLLRDGKEAIAPVPEERWDIDAFYDPDPDTPGKMNARWGGFLEQVDHCDADFFRMSVREVEHTDPQQRLFWEVAWEALETAAIAPTSLAGSQTGVFIGLCTIDYHRLLYKDFSCIGPHSGTGTTPCITANRFSYFLDLHGPSMAVDTACSSSLVTVHLACQSLRSGESNLCIAGGVNLILSPDSTISSSQTRLLSANGRCQTFDASADGYVRGEGCGAVVLKRLADAVADGDTILALIRGSAVNQDGRSNSFTAPNGLAQQAVIRRALANANVQPAEISYVDAHAVGTSIGDAVEFEALKAVLSSGREPERSCWIGSVKPNIGHLEAAAGMSALIKVVLSLQHEEIPPHLHLKQLNPYIALKNTPFSIPTERQPWTCDQNRIAGVSAFGFGGTNAHVILEEAPRSPAVEGLGSIPERPYQILILSAKSEVALKELAHRYEDFLASHPKALLADVCFTANTGRTHFNHRLGIVTASIPQLRQQLNAFITEQETTGVLRGEVKGRKRPKVAFLFPDEETFTIDPQLYETLPTRAAIAQCAQILSPDLKKPSLESFPPTVKRFAIQYALAQLWQSWGIKPKEALGCGVGEYVAATVAGCELEEALKRVAKCSKPSCLEVEALTEKVKSLSEGAFYVLRLPQQENWQTILHSLGELYVRGAAIDWFKFDQDYCRRRLQLPTYPFQRQRYWFKTPAEEPQQIEHLLETGNFSEAQRQLLPLMLQALAQHSVNGTHSVSR